MAEINQFGSAKPVRSGEGTSCAQCEAMLADWMDDSIDGVLTPKDRAAFDLHIATCAECSQMLADAQRGAALLEMLKSPRPEPSALLLDRIIAQTSGLNAPAGVPTKSNAAGVIHLPALDGGSLEIHSVVPAPPAVAGIATPVPFAAPATNVLPFRRRVTAKFNLRTITHTMMQPRLAMTAAMAFFSIALTLNLTGVHLNELKASDLTPSNLKRSFYQADASVVRYYDNLRVVYELESRVRDLKRSNEGDEPGIAPSTGGSDTNSNTNSKDGSDKSRPAGTEPGANQPGANQPSKDEQRKQTPKSGSGTSQRRSPLDQEFKLAAWNGRQSFGLPSSNTALLQAIRAPRTNKSKERSQEGDLV